MKNISDNLRTINLCRMVAIAPLLLISSLVGGCGNSCQDLSKKSASMLVKVGGIEETAKSDIAVVMDVRLDGDPKGENGVVIPSLATAIQEIEALNISDANLKSKQQDYVSNLKILQKAMTDWRDPSKRVEARKVIAEVGPKVEKSSKELMGACTP